MASFHGRTAFSKPEHMRKILFSLLSCVSSSSRSLLRSLPFLDSHRLSSNTTCNPSNKLVPILYDSMGKIIITDFFQPLCQILQSPQDQQIWTTRIFNRFRVIEECNYNVREVAGPIFKSQNERQHFLMRELSYAGFLGRKF